jgi:hypothetical protein
MLQMTVVAGNGRFLWNIYIGVPLSATITPVFQYLMKLPVEDLWASVSQTIHSNMLVFLLSCSPGPPTPLSILVRASVCCSVKGVVHIVVQDLQFLGNFSHGIALMSQNKNRLMSFRRKSFVSGHFEPVIVPTNADSPDTQLV